jgi:hypothetical protein
MSGVAAIYFRIAKPALLPLLVNLYLPFACANVIPKKIPGRITFSSSFGSTQCGTTEHIFIVVVAVVLSIGLCVSHSVIEAFLQIQDKYRTIMFSPASLVRLSMLQLVSIAFTVACVGFRGISLGTHAVIMGLCLAISGTRGNREPNVEFLTLGTTMDASSRSSSSILSRYQRMMDRDGVTAGGDSVFCTSPLASRFRRLGFLTALVSAVGELVVYATLPDIASNQSWKGGLSKCQPNPLTTTLPAEDKDGAIATELLRWRVRPLSSSSGASSPSSSPWPPSSLKVGLVGLPLFSRG